MKTHLAPWLLTLAAATSCGLSAQFAAGSQQFEDGIYAAPRAEAPAAAVSQEEMDALVRESIESEVYVLSAEGDTIVVPQGKTAKLRFNESGTDITVADAYGWDYSWAYRPWYLHGYYSPWYYASWSYWDPWYWDSWYYRPWYGSYHPWGWYDPWYYASWYYDPWYWGGYPYHHYGYYGGWYSTGGWGGRFPRGPGHAGSIGHRDASLSSRSLVSRSGSSRSGSAVSRLFDRPDRRRPVFFCRQQCGPLFFQRPFPLFRFRGDPFRRDVREPLFRLFRRQEPLLAKQQSGELPPVHFFQKQRQRQFRQLLFRQL